MTSFILENLLFTYLKGETDNSNFYTVQIVPYNTEVILAKPVDG